MRFQQGEGLLPSTDHDAVYGARLGGAGAEPVLDLVDGEAAAAAAGGGQAEAGQRGEGGEQLHGAGETAWSAAGLGHADKDEQ